MENFQFVSPTRLILQKDAELEVGSEVRKYADKVLLVHYGDPFLYQSGLHDRITTSLNQAGVAYEELTGIQPNPVLAPIRKGIALCREQKIPFILAVGGGSVIDTAKAIAAGSLYEGDVWDLYLGKAPVEQALALGTVMTLPGTGSEGSNGSVVTNEDTLEKRDIMSDAIRPCFAVMNPELTYTLPPFQTACGIVDMLSHVMERYFSNSKQVILTDHLCEGLMKAIVENGRKLQKDPRDYHARADLMLGAVLAHNGLAGIGRNQDWACHMMGAQLSGEYNAVHGATLSVLIPAWASYVYQENLDRFVQFANRVFGVEVDFYAPERTALEGIRRLQAFYQELGMPLTMEELNIKDDKRFASMAMRSTGGGRIGCMKPLSSEDVEAIYRLACANS